MKSELDRIVQSIDRQIPKRARMKGMPPLQIFLPWKKYQAFYAWLRPLHEKVHGGVLCDDVALKSGYENILYKGVPVCLEPQRPLSIKIGGK